MLHVILSSRAFRPALSRIPFFMSRKTPSCWFSSAAIRRKASSAFSESSASCDIAVVVHQAGATLGRASRSAVGTCVVGRARRVVLDAIPQTHKHVGSFTIADATPSLIKVPLKFFYRSSEAVGAGSRGPGTLRVLEEWTNEESRGPGPEVGGTEGGNKVLRFSIFSPDLPPHYKPTNHGVHLGAVVVVVFTAWAGAQGAQVPRHAPRRTVLNLRLGVLSMACRQRR